MYAAFILNNLPYRNGANETRESRFMGRPPPRGPNHRVVVWGCLCYAYALVTGHRPKTIGASKLVEGILLGYDERRKCFRVALKRDRYEKIKISANVTVEDKFPFAQQA